MQSGYHFTTIRLDNLQSALMQYDFFPASDSKRWFEAYAGFLLGYCLSRKKTSSLYTLFFNQTSSELSDVTEIKEFLSLNDSRFDEGIDLLLVHSKLVADMNNGIEGQHLYDEEPAVRPIQVTSLKARKPDELLKLIRNKTSRNIYPNSSLLILVRDFLNSNYLEINDTTVQNVANVIAEYPNHKHFAGYLIVGITNETDFSQPIIRPISPGSKVNLILLWSAARGGVDRRTLAEDI